jgi:hypothetical protein
MFPRVGLFYSTALLCAFLVGACVPVNGLYMASVAPDLRPRMTARDVIAISRGFLDDQTPQLAAPELHIPPRITSVWAVRANEASTLDGCIPVVPADQMVWVTKGQGDYLNLSDHPWSKAFSESSQLDPNPSRMICEAPGPQGTLVIDDATGVILGVYPESPGYWHSSAASK